MADKRSVFGRMEERITSLSAEAEALAEVSNDELTVSQREEDLEAELARLKEKMRGEDS
jgi:phage shock protein A